MEKKIEDYLHFYIKSNVEVKVPGGKLPITAKIIDQWEFCYHGIKPILRPLSDKTKEEWDWLDSIKTKYDEFISDELCIQASEVTSYLLSKGFDLFGLIEAGLAIDKTKV